MRKGLLYTALAGVFSSYMLSSCSGVFSNYTSLFSSLPDADAGRPAIPSDRFFYVKISDATFRGSQGHDLLDYVMYEKENGPGYDCKIAKNEQDSTEDLYCMFEVLEGDLYLHDMEFEYNVPAGMCDYFSFQTHWHYNQESGYGPTRVFKETKKELKYCSEPVSEGSECPDTCLTFRSPAFNIPANCPVGVEYRLGKKITMGSCPLSQSICKIGKDENNKNSYYEISRVAEETKEELCIYNNTREGEGKNCCAGEYYLHDLDAQDKEPGRGQWGGDISQCVGGLSRSSPWEAGHTKDGFPKTLIKHSISGLRARYEIKALLGVLGTKIKVINGVQTIIDHRYSLVTANYFEGIEDGTNLPRFYQSSQDTEDDFGHRPLEIPGYPYITWSCMDKAKEIKHRIHLIIREWNTRAEFEEFKSGGTGDPDVADTEGGDCEYYEQDDDNIGDFHKRRRNDCNDMKDVDDFVSSGDPYPELEYTD